MLVIKGVGELKVLVITLGGIVMNLNAVSDANAAWESQSVSVLISGDLDTSKPSFDIELGFFFQIVEWQSENYIEAFNERIEQLVYEQGYPQWGPRRRLPSRVDIAEFLEGGQNISNTDKLKVKEKRLVSHVCNKLQKPIGACLRFDELDLLAVVALDSSACVLVNVLDCREFRWMAKYSFLQKHVDDSLWTSLKSLAVAVAE